MSELPIDKNQLGLFVHCNVGTKDKPQMVVITRALGEYIWKYIVDHDKSSDTN